MNAILQQGKDPLKTKLSKIIQDYIAGSPENNFTQAAKDLILREGNQREIEAWIAQDSAHALEKSRVAAVMPEDLDLIAQVDTSQKLLPEELQLFASLMPVDLSEDEFIQEIPFSYICYRKMAQHISLDEKVVKIHLAASLKLLERYIELRKKGIRADEAFEACIAALTPRMAEKFSWRRFVEDP